MESPTPSAPTAPDARAGDGGRPNPTPQPPAGVRLALLLLPLVVALGVWWQGRHYDPALLDFTGKGGDGTEAARLLPARLGGLQRLGALRLFQPGNLWEYVNGHAEFFLSAGFQGLTVAEYGPPGAAPVLVVDLYHMGTPLQAFGTLVDETGGGAQPVELGGMGFRAGGTVSFIHGPYYVKVAGFDAQVPVEEAARGVAERLAQQISEASLTFKFPDLGTPTATRFVKEGYRGLAFLNGVLERTFQRPGGGTVSAFLLNAPPQRVREASAALEGYLAEEGIAVEPLERDGLRLWHVRDPYEGEWLYLPLPQSLLGVFAPPSEPLITAILAFVRNEQTPQDPQ